MRNNPINLSKIHRSVFHGGNLTYRNAASIRRRIELGVNHDFLSVDRTAVVSGQIEITVICQIADGVSICNSVIVNFQGVFPQGISNPNVQFSGIAFVHMIADKG